MEGCCRDRLAPRRQGSHKTGERRGEDANSYSSGAYKEEATNSREVNKAELIVLADRLKKRDKEVERLLEGVSSTLQKWADGDSIGGGTNVRKEFLAPYVYRKPSL